MFPCLLMLTSVDIGINDIAARNLCSCWDFHGNATRRFLAGATGRDDFPTMVNLVVESSSIEIILGYSRIVNFIQNACSVSCIEDTYVPRTSVALHPTPQVTSKSRPQISSFSIDNGLCVSFSGLCGVQRRFG